MRLVTTFVLLLTWPGLTWAGDVAKRHGKTVNEWLEQLAAKDVKARIQACQALGDFGREGKAAAAPLAKRLKDAKADLRFAAADALRRIGPAAKEAVPALVETLDDDDKGVSVAVIRALAGIGPLAKEAAPALAKATGDRDSAVALAAAEALANLGETGPAVLDALSRAAKDSDPALRREAVRTAASLVPAGELHRKLAAAALKDSHADVRRSILESLLDIGDVARGQFLEASDTTTTLLGLAVKDPSPEMRRLAFRVLAGSAGVGKLGAVATVAKELLADSDGQVRVQAAAYLVRSPKAEPTALDVWMKALADEDPLVRLAAVNAVGVGKGFDPTPFVKGLVEALGDKSAAVRRAAAQKLHDQPAHAALCAKTMRQLLEHPDADVRGETLLVMRGVGQDELAVVLKSLDDNSAFVRRAAAYALANAGAASNTSDIRGSLQKALGDLNPLVRVAAAGSLLHFGTEDEAAKKVLLDALGNDDLTLRSAVLRAVKWWVNLLPSSSTVAKFVEPTLRDMAREDPSPELRRMAISIIAVIEAHDDNAKSKKKAE
jgi:HEAT repeat protein